MEDKLRLIKAFVASVSGVLHNNQDIVGEVDGKPFKGLLRSHYDGQGVSLLRAVGIKVAFVTTDSLNSTDLVFQLVERWNNLPSSSKMEGDGGWPRIKLISDVVGTEQIAPVKKWLNESGLSFNDCAVMGHDLVQVPLLRMALLRIAPAQAEDVVKKMVHYVTPRPGGNGALRDVANKILEVREIDQTTLPTR